jgi:thymidylate kinase
MEDLGDGFRRRVSDGYKRLAEREETPWLVVDGAGTVEEVAAEVWAGVQDRLGVPA